MPTVLELSQQPDFQGESKLIDLDAALKDPRFERAVSVYQYWQVLNAQGTPLRRMIDPIELGARILPYLVLIDALKGGEDYRWRLFGSRHEAEYGTSLKGMTLSELSAANPAASIFKSVLDATITLTEPQFFQLHYYNRRSIGRIALGVVVPLWEEGPTPTVILGAADWIEHPPNA